MGEREDKVHLEENPDFKVTLKKKCLSSWLAKMNLLHYGACSPVNAKNCHSLSQPFLECILLIFKI